MIYLSKWIKPALAMAFLLGAWAAADIGTNANEQEKGPAAPKKTAADPRGDGPQIVQDFVAPWDNDPDIGRQINLKRVQIIRFQPVDVGNEVMTATQWLRRRQIQLQYVVYDAFRDPILSEKLNLTPQQRTTLELYGYEWREQVSDLSREYRSNDPVAAERLDAMRKLADDRIYSLLTEEQRAVWAQAMGEPYPFSPAAYFQGR